MTRSVVQCRPPDDLVDRSLVPFEDHLDPAVLEVTGAARDAGFGRPLPRRVAEEDTLNAAGYQDPLADGHAFGRTTIVSC